MPCPSYAGICGCHCEERVFEATKQSPQPRSAREPRAWSFRNPKGIATSCLPALLARRGGRNGRNKVILNMSRGNPLWLPNQSRPYGGNVECAKKVVLGRDWQGEHRGSPLQGMAGSGFTLSGWVYCPPPCHCEERVPEATKQSPQPRSAREPRAWSSPNS